MGRPTTWSVVEEFQKKADIKDPAVQKAMGLNSELLDHYWTGLNAMGPETGTAIPDIETVLGKSGAALVSKLEKKGLIKQHSDGKKMILTSEALERMTNVIKAAGEQSTNGSSAGKKPHQKNTQTRKGGKLKAQDQPVPEEPASPTADSPADAANEAAAMGSTLSAQAALIAARQVRIHEERQRITDESDAAIRTIQQDRDEKLEALKREEEEFVSFIETVYKSITGQVE
ncbi:MAG: hypothetical protein WDN47_00050 [Candidatus Doudnabacteria bacterium]